MSSAIKFVCAISFLLVFAKSTVARKSDDKCNEYIQLARTRRDVGDTGKEPAKPGEFPHMAALLYGDEKTAACAGILISDQYILTTAHCLFHRTLGPPVAIRLGDHNINSSTDDANAQEYAALGKIRHPEYKPPAIYNDIGLVKLATQVTFNNFVRPACLQTEEALGTNEVIATGWGQTSYNGSASDSLQKVVLDVYTNDECGKHEPFASKPRALKNGIAPSMLCAGGRTVAKSTCRGDAGGPYQVLRKGYSNVYNVVGVISFGVPCGQVNVPEIGTRVSSYVAWIEGIVWP